MTSTLVPRDGSAVGPDAETPAPSGRWRRWGPWLAGFACATVLLSLFPLLPRPVRGVNPPPIPPIWVTPVPPPSGLSGASGPLVAVADLIESMASDSMTGLTFIEVEHWSPRDGMEIVGFREQRWRADDGSGRVTVWQLAAAQPAQGFNLGQVCRTDFNVVTQVTRDYAAGGLTAAVYGPVATGPEALLVQLVSVPQPESAVLVDSIIGLYGWNYLGRDSRAAALRLLAIVDGLTYDDPTTDRACRVGIGVSLTATGVHQSLVIDQRTGQLLASERAVPGFVLDDYTLYLRTKRQPTLG